MDLVHKFSCIGCGYYTSSCSNYKAHNKSKKHIDIVNNKTTLYECVTCNKKLTTNAGLWNHKKKCIPENKLIITTRKELRSELSSVMTEFKDEIAPLQQISNTTNNTQTNNTQTNNSNSNNSNNINITMFLNEHCSGAIDFMDFMKSIQIDRNYRENMLANGFVKTICSTIKETLDKTPMLQRPIHYIENEDDNQQIIHIRDNQEWRKETELQWTSQIHDFYSGELPEDTSEADKKKIFFGLKQLEDNILAKITEYYSRSIQFKIFERENQSEMNYVPNKLKIIKYLLENIKIDKDEIASIIDSPENILSI